MQVFVANESNANVWFDDLTHSVAPIVQENHYDPFGLHLGGLVERQGTPEHPFQYNAGSEKQPDVVGYGYSYATDWRGYDPQLGRFHGIDALSKLSSDITPYQYGLNNPVSFNDPSGKIVPALAGALIGAGVGGAVGGIISVNNGGSFWSGAWKGALIGAGVGAAAGYGLEQLGVVGQEASAVGSNGYYLTKSGELSASTGKGAMSYYTTPLTRDRLYQIAKAAGHIDNGTGAFKANVGNYFEELALKAFHLTQNNKTYLSPLRAAMTIDKTFVKPDAVGSVHVLSRSPQELAQSHFIEVEGEFTEVKATNKTSLAPSYDNYQLLGELDALSRTPGGLQNKAVITYITLGNTNLGAKLLLEAQKRNIAVYQSKALEAIIDGIPSGQIMFSAPQSMLNPLRTKRLQGPLTPGTNSYPFPPPR